MEIDKKINTIINMTTNLPIGMKRKEITERVKEVDSMICPEIKKNHISKRQEDLMIMVHPDKMIIETEEVTDLISKLTEILIEQVNTVGSERLLLHKKETITCPKEMKSTDYTKKVRSGDAVET